MAAYRLKEIICLLSCIMLSACLANVPTKEIDNLNEEVKTYGKLIRWYAYDEAAAYIRHPEGEAIVVNTEALKEIRVTKYEVLSMVVSEDKTEAQVAAEISYYHERVNNVHTIQDKQLWWLDEESGKWFINGQLPALDP